MEIINC